MTSLMVEEALKKEEAVEQEIKRKQHFTLQRLQKLNEQQNEGIKKYKSKDGKYKGKYEFQQTNLMTAPRFEVILEIFKKQDDRIQELEAIITKLQQNSNKN
jgi:hypothetical protein